VTKQQMIQAMKKCAAELGRTPRKEELLRHLRVGETMLRLRFGNYTRALQQAGLHPAGHYKLLEMKDLFEDWAGVARKLARVPTMADYKKHSQYSFRPLLGRFGHWNRVPEGMQAFAESARLGRQWRDVLKVVKSDREKKKAGANQQYVPMGKPRVWTDRPFFGPPAVRTAMAHGPVNEAGVIFLFGALAMQLGFMVLQMRTEFPDCEAMREVEPERLQRLLIEIEYESRNFLKHFHSVKGCDMIVCWIHNWPECPLEVVELRSVVREIYQERAKR
jgi:hypothetical protein